MYDLNTDAPYPRCRYYSHAVLASLHRSLAIQRWHHLHLKSIDPLEKALAAFDIFASHNQEEDFEKVRKNDQGYLLRQSTYVQRYRKVLTDSPRKFVSNVLDCLTRHYASRLLKLQITYGATTFKGFVMMLNIMTYRTISSGWRCGTRSTRPYRWYW